MAQSRGENILDRISFSLEGKIRDKRPSDSYLRKIAAIAKAVDPSLGVRITSGAQARKGSGGKRTGSTRHDVDEHGHGHTADFVLTRNGQDILPGDDPQLYAKFINRAAPSFPGIGHYDWGIHVGGGSEAFWGPTKKAASADPIFAQAFRLGRQGKGLDQGLLASIQGIVDPTQTGATAPAQGSEGSGLSWLEGMEKALFASGSQSMMGDDTYESQSPAWQKATKGTGQGKTAYEAESPRWRDALKGIDFGGNNVSGGSGTSVAGSSMDDSLTDSSVQIDDGGPIAVALGVLDAIASGNKAAREARGKSSFSGELRRSTRTSPSISSIEAQAGG